MNNVEVIGQMDNTIDNTFESANRVYSDNGLCPTIPTCGGGGVQPKILEVGYMDNGTGKHQSNTVYDENGLCPNITIIEGGGTQQIKVCTAQIEKVGQISNDGSQYGTVISDNGIASNLVAGTHGYANNCIQTQYRIRKLTPRECGRLMAVSDEDIDKILGANSDTQAYKQFGNSIVVDVMCAMFRNLNIKQK